MKAKPPHKPMKSQLPPPVLMASQEATKSHQDSDGRSVTPEPEKHPVAKRAL